LVKAHKLRGDDCVGDDQRTWEGTYAGRSPFTVRFFNAMGEAPGQMQVLAPDRLVLRDKTDQVVTFVRQPAPAPPEKTAPAPAAKTAPAPVAKPTPATPSKKTARPISKRQKNP
jgi:hypothetical protein